MVAGNPFAANLHADVMATFPTDEAGKLRLVEEVKHRAKGAFQQKDMPSAELLYGKAIEMLDTLPGKQEAVLYSNRAMVRLNLNKPEDALADCKKCLGLDAGNVKAWHRRAESLVRLNDWDEAIAAAQEGQKLDASNKSFQAMIDKATSDKAKDVEDKAKLKSDAQDVRVELHNASTARQPLQKKERKEGAEDEDLGMRGYKKTADGKTTSYFHTEISDEAKRLIAEQGFGKPQKLEGPVDDNGASEKSSAWNKAGTYEEKGMLKWAQEQLSSRLKGLIFDVPAGAGGKIVTTAVEDIKGEANISSSRGKRRFLLDLTFKVLFEVEIEGGKGSGTFVVTELTTDDEPEISVEIGADSSPAVREVLGAFAKPAGQGLQPMLRHEIAKLVTDYKEK